MQDYLSDLYKKLSGKMKLGRQRAEMLMRELGHPEKAFPSIHIAGTNGKGTVTTVAAAILQQLGYKTGKFTSPHLMRFNERISVAGKEINDNYIKLFLANHDDLLEKSEASFFEVTTALGFQYFKDQAVDIAVVETGLGGRLDATSVLTPDVSVITTIGYDHTAILGETLPEIAAEKAGIIKEGKPVLTLPQSEKVLNVFREKTDLLSIVDPKDLFADVKQTPQGMRFNYLPESRELLFPICGEHLLGNIGLAIAAVECFLGKKLKADDLQKAFDILSWKGRFEHLSFDPPVIYDVAHNFQGVAAFCKTAMLVYPDRGFIAVMGLLDDKSPEKVMQELSVLNGKIILAPVNSHRSMSMEKLQALAENYPGVKTADSVTQACERAYDKMKENDVLLILGSHYIAEEVYGFTNNRMSEHSNEIID